MRKLAPARVSYRDDFLISYRVYMMKGSFHISLFELFEGTLHVDEMQVWFKIANITHALPVRVYWQILHWKGWSLRVYMILLRDFIHFSLRYKNRGELTPGWLALAWHFVVVSCKQLKSHEREPEWSTDGAKVAPVSCKQPLFVTKHLTKWKSLYHSLIYRATFFYQDRSISATAQHFYFIFWTGISSSFYSVSDVVR